MKERFTKESIEEFLAIKAFYNTMAELYRYNCRYPKENITYSQIENEKLWAKIRRKK